MPFERRRRRSWSDDQQTRPHPPSAQNPPQPCWPYTWKHNTRFEWIKFITIIIPWNLFPFRASLLLHKFILSCLSIAIELFWPLLSRHFFLTVLRLVPEILNICTMHSVAMWAVSTHTLVYFFNVQISTLICGVSVHRILIVVFCFKYIFQRANKYFNVWRKCTVFL